jgi:hypothetical protein
MKNVSVGTLLGDTEGKECVEESSGGNVSLSVGAIEETEGSVYREF